MLTQCLTLGVENFAIVEGYLLVSYRYIYPRHCCLSIVTTLSLPHCSCIVIRHVLHHLVLHSCRLVWTSHVLYLTWQRTLHGLAIEHSVDLIATIFGLSICIRFTRERLFIITMLLVDHHRWCNWGLNNTCTHLALYLLWQLTVLTARRWEWFGVYTITWLLPLMLPLEIELVLRAFLA